METKNSHSYFECGKGPTLVLLPSFGLTSRSFYSIAKNLAQFYRVIVPDLYRGKSVYQMGAKKIADYTRALHSLIQDLCIPNFYLVGISYSGFIATDYALQYPRDLKKLFLINTSLVPIKKKMKFVAYPIAFLKIIWQNFFSQLGRKINALLLTDVTMNMLRNPRQLLQDSLISLSVGEDKNIIEMPVLTKIILAEHDEFIPPQAIESMQSIRNLAIDIIPDNHVWFLKDEDLLVTKIRDFFDLPPDSDRNSKRKSRFHIPN